MDIEIRRARPSDHAALAALTVELGYDGNGIGERLEAIATASNAAVLVAVAGGSVVGWVHVHDAALVQVPSFAEVGGLVVSDRHRGEGIGEALLAACEAWATGRGHNGIRVRSNATRERAHRFYQRQGYAVEKTSLTFHKAL